MKNFFDEHAAPWEDASGQLHIYALPSESFCANIEPWRESLCDISGLAQQPCEYLHLTVQRLPYMLNDKRSEIDSLIRAIQSEFDEIDSIDLQFATPTILDNSVVLRAEQTSSWETFTDAVRKGIAKVFGEDGLFYEPPALGAHVTLAYGTEECDDDTIAMKMTQASMKVRHEEEFLKINLSSIVLVTVHVDVESGVYSFEKLGEITCRR